MRLAPAGVREWGGGGLIAGVVVALAWWLIPIGWVVWTLTGVALLGWFCVAWFFRDPTRRPPADLDAGDLLSPADGRISAVETVDHHAAVEGPAVVVRIFLSVLNVHVNRMPCDVKVLETMYAPGKFLDARTAESAKVNEAMLVRARRSDGLPLGIRQVSGAIARRIVCPVTQGQRFARGERYGMIKFGSTTELIVPRDCGHEVRVAAGDAVRGGSTVLARVDIQPSGSPA